MCILCVVSRWSRRIVTMLPWFVIPFIITWAFSQLLPPGYRLEVTSTRLACLGVLLSSLGWYELLMPWLSSWRARRSALLRERRLIEAQEAAKMRKEATRRCRNCLTAYKVQTPGCGKFTCTNCGHVSKRPVLEVPASVTHLGSQGPKIVSHNSASIVTLRTSARHDSNCWSRSSEKRGCWFMANICSFENYKALQWFLKVLSLAGHAVSFARKSWRTLTAAEKMTPESSSSFQNSKDDLASLHESKIEKARKKAYEKRQARLEKELLDAEERKQREDVARLVEERRKQREQKLQIEQESEREAAAERERELRRVRELERRRKDKAKERVGEEVVVETDLDVPLAENISKAREITPSKPSAVVKQGAFKGFHHESGARFKGGIDEKFDPSKNIGIAKRRHLLPTSKMGSVCHTDSPSSSRTGGVWKGSKTVKIEAPGSPHNEKAPFSDSGGRKAPWFNAWSKGSELLKEDITKTHTDPAIRRWQRLDQSKREPTHQLCNKAVGANQLPSSVGTSVIQPPIAPPSMQTPLHQLFSSPTIFPPLDLPVEFASRSEQAEIKASFLSEHTFFESPACVTVPSCKPIGGSSDPCPPAAPLTVQSSLPSLQQPSFSPKEAQPSCKVVSDNSLFFGAASLPDMTKTTGIDCNPLPPRSFPVSDLNTLDMANFSPTSSEMDLSKLDLRHQETMYWEVPCTFLDKLNNISERTEGQLWCLQDVKVDEALGLSHYKEHRHEEALQLPHLSTVQSLFGSEISLPDSLPISPSKEMSSLNGDDVACAAQVFDRKSLWSDISAFNAAVQIWDDAENHLKVPPEFVDCITQEIMRDPVITADGHSYERTAIEKWLKHHDTSPKTGEVLPPPPGGVGVDKTLRPNHILRGQIIEYKEKLAKMQPRALSWSNSKDGDFLTKPSTVGVLIF